MGVVLPCDDEAPEQLDWGTIHDEDGAFGQIEAASSELEERELDLEDCAESARGRSVSSGGVGSLPPCSPAAGEIQDGGVPDLGKRAEAQEGNPALYAQSSAAMEGKRSPCAINSTDPPPATMDLEAPSHTTRDAVADSGVRFTSVAKKPAPPDSGGSPHGASAQDGRFQVGDPKLPATVQPDSASPSNFDGDGSGCGGGRAITSATGASSIPASTRKVIHSTHPAWIPASELYRPEAPNVPIQAAEGRMSYHDAVRSKPAKQSLHWRTTNHGARGGKRTAPLDINAL